MDTHLQIRHGYVDRFHVPLRLLYVVQVHHGEEYHTRSLRRAQHGECLPSPGSTVSEHCDTCTPVIYGYVHTQGRHELWSVRVDLTGAVISVYKGAEHRLGRLLIDFDIGGWGLEHSIKCKLYIARLASGAVLYGFTMEVGDWNDKISIKAEILNKDWRSNEWAEVNKWHHLADRSPRWQQ